VTGRAWARSRGQPSSRAERQRPGAATPGPPAQSIFPADSTAIEQRAAATGEEGERLTEAGRRLEAAATNLAAVEMGHLSGADVIPGAIRLIDQAAAEIGRATGDD
jgi:hypothetical protein